jgi:hypothetical protein
MTPDEFASLALSLPGVTESAHFGKRDFRAGGKIFATLPAETSANLKLTPDQQLMMVEMHAGLFAALPNAWGLRGWTSLALALAERDIALHALEIARENVLAKKPKKA